MYDIGFTEKELPLPITDRSLNSSVKIKMDDGHYIMTSMSYVFKEKQIFMKINNSRFKNRSINQLNYEMCLL